MTYQEMVVEARRLLDEVPDNEWALGDLSLRALAAFTTRDRGAITWSKDIGLGTPSENVTRIWETAEAWPPKNRVADVSWYDHADLNDAPNRFDIIWPEGLPESEYIDRAIEDFNEVADLLADMVGVNYSDSTDEQYQRLDAAKLRVEDELGWVCRGIAHNRAASPAHVRAVVVTRAYDAWTAADRAARKAAASSTIDEYAKALRAAAYARAVYEEACKKENQ